MRAASARICGSRLENGDERVLVSGVMSRSAKVAAISSADFFAAGAFLPLINYYGKGSECRAKPITRFP